MSLIPYNALFNDHFVDQFFSPKRVANNDFFSPKVDIAEKDTHFIVTAELPGVKKENLHIHLDDGTLTIEAETENEQKEEKDGKVIRQERSYGKYSRSFGIGSNIKEDDIDANYTDGVLKLTFPKTEAVNPSRKKIEIS